jgi:serine/threonine protein kinase
MADDIFGIVGTTQAGNYKVERVVAEGGFGVVYRALHGGFRAPVALKCLKIPEELTRMQREVFLEKFREEGELLFRLSAAIPEVVRPLNIDVLKLDDGRFVPFLAMEWLEGESLGEIITRRNERGEQPLDIGTLVKMLRPVAHALSRAHRFQGPNGAESIIHRDLKPENILIATIGGVSSVKILDFGIAKAKRVATQAAGRLVESTTALGLAPEEDDPSFTPGYGAPEQWAPKRFGDTGVWTDVWGLALTLTEVMIGGPAIDGPTIEAMRAVALDEKRRPTPGTLGANVSAAIDAIFEHALAVNPRRRFPSIEAFWAQLEDAVGVTPSFAGAQGASLSATPVPEPARIPAPQPSGPAKLAQIKLNRVHRAAAAMVDEVELQLPSVDDADSSLEFDLVDASQLPSAPPPPAPAAPTAAPPVASPAPSRAAARPSPAPAPPPRAAPPAPNPARISSASLEFDLDASTAEPEPPRPPAPGRVSETEFELPTGPEGVAPAPAYRPPVSALGAGSFDLAAPASIYRPVIRNLPQAPRSHEAHSGASSGLVDRFRGPVQVILAAVAIAIGDLVYARSVGGPVMLGPIRLSWISATIGVLGVGFALWRLIGDRDDG